MHVRAHKCTHMHAQECEIELMLKLPSENRVPLFSGPAERPQKEWCILGINLV